MAKTTKKNEADLPAIPDEKQLPAVIHDFGDDFGAGVDGIDQREVGIPFVKILQAQSPEVIGPEGRIEGARAGMLLNTGTGELMEEARFVPAIRQHVFAEWRPRKQGGGLVATYPVDSPVVRASQDEAKAAGRRFNELKTEAGNDLVETFYVFGVLLDENDTPTGMVVIPFSSTAIKRYSKGFMNRIKYCLVSDGNGRKRNPPMFAHRVIISTQQESNDSGTWSNYNIEFAVNNNVMESLMDGSFEAYQAAKALHAAVGSGDAAADTTKADRVDKGDDGGAAF